MSSYDESETNPFANPSGRSAASPSAPTMNKLQNEYNPFTNPGLPAATPALVTPTFTSNYASPASPSSPVRVQQPVPTIPNYETTPYSPSATPYREVPSVSAPAKEKDKKVKELEEREARLAAREKEINSSKTGERKNNFPPLPSRCPLKPCFHQDINGDIATPFRRWVRLSFIIWIIYGFGLLFNVIVCAAYLAVDSGTATTFGVSFVLFFLLVPASYVCWHRPLYRAFRVDSALFFMIFFFMSIMFIGTNILFAIGFDKVSGGFIRVDAFKDSTAIGVMMICMGVIWCAVGILSIVLLFNVHRVYRQSGASLEKAQSELQSTFVNSPAVRGAARDVAAAGINSALSSSNA